MATVEPHTSDRGESIWIRPTTAPSSSLGDYGCFETVAWTSLVEPVWYAALAIAPHLSAPHAFSGTASLRTWLGVASGPAWTLASSSADLAAMPAGPVLDPGAGGNGGIGLLAGLLPLGWAHRMWSRPAASLRTWLGRINPCLLPMGLDSNLWLTAIPHVSQH